MEFSKLKEIGDKKFTFDENDGNFSDRVENAEEKGEIARYEQFLLFRLLQIRKKKNLSGI